MPGIVDKKLVIISNTSVSVIDSKKDVVRISAI